MARDFKKLGLDRISQNIATSVNRATGNLVTGDITRGEVVEVAFNNSTTGTAQVKERRVGAIPLDQPFATDSWEWSISGTTLTVVYQGNQTGTSRFWVF